MNAWSSLAFVVAGVAIASKGRRAVPTGVAAMLVGIGSLLFHGDGGDLAGWLHDWSIAALLLVLLVPTTGGSLRVYVVVALAALLPAVVSGTAEWMHAVLAVGLLAKEATAWRGRRTAPLALAGGLVVVGAMLALFGRSGGPWCEPGSGFQAHAGWHLAAAAALVAYSAARGWFAMGDIEPAPVSPTSSL